MYSFVYKTNTSQNGHQELFHNFIFTKLTRLLQNFLKGIEVSVVLVLQFFWFSLVVLNY